MRFEATLDDQAVVVPAEVLDALGGGGRIPVQATFDGVAYRGSVVTMGGRKVIGVTRAILAEIGKGHGDTITVTLERDVEERIVDVPDDLAAALDAAGVRAGFDALSYTKRKEHVRTITEAKKDETRASRVAKAVEAART